MSAPSVETSLAANAEDMVGGLPADNSLPQTRFSLVVDRLIRRIGGALSWVWLALVGVIIYNVVQRYVFGIGAIWLEEMQWHLYAVGFMVGLSYCFSADRHVRVDVLAERWGQTTRAWVEILGLSLLLLPFCTAILIEAVPYVWTSFTLNETSAAPGGLPLRWLLKSFIIWGFGLLWLAAFARLLRALAAAIGWPKPIWPRD